MPTTATATLLEPLLPAVVAIARRAGEAILAIYGRDFVVEHKADESPLTEADLASHRIIEQELAELLPQVPILSEESAEVPLTERLNWRRLWVVDPLDGTKEFVKRNGEFTVNIALVQDGLPILGVVHAPVLGRTYYAATGLGAWVRQGEDKGLRIQTVPAATPLRVVASRSHGSAELEALVARLPEHTTVTIGSSLKMCLVAEGQADFYPRLAPTYGWDTAAGQCVVEQAGGLVTDTAMDPLRYNQRDTHLNPHFLVIGDPTHPWASYFAAT